MPFGAREEIKVFSQEGGIERDFEKCLKLHDFEGQSDDLQCLCIREPWGLGVECASIPTIVKSEPLMPEECLGNLNSNSKPLHRSSNNEVQ